MYLLYIFIALTWGQALALSLKPYYRSQDYETLFSEFIKKYERKYKNEQEKHLRFEAFIERLKIINEQNLQNEHAAFVINQFSDYTEEETQNLIQGVGISEWCLNTCNVMNSTDMFVEADEESFDWREHNVITNIKNQQYCGSCWAFSTIANIEAQYAIKYKKSLLLSEQQVIDCDQTNNGCAGGAMCRAFRSIINQGGLMAEEDYPYTARNKTCKKDNKKYKVKLSDCNIYDIKEEEKLKTIIKNVGPLSIGVTGRDLLSYGEGIGEWECKSKITTHAVLIIGWGSENGVPYWIFKNSFGSSWGEDGYFRMKRGVNSSCLMIEPSSTAVL